MTKNLLLPYGFKKIGWAIFIPAAAYGLLVTGLWIFDGPDPDELWRQLGVATSNTSTSFLGSTSLTHWLNNLCIFGLVLGSLLIGCSKERIEDELVAHIRHNSLLIALWISYGILLVASLLVYDLDFINVMIYNMFTMLLIFLAVFRFKLWRLRREASHTL